MQVKWEMAAVVLCKCAWENTFGGRINQRRREKGGKQWFGDAPASRHTHAWECQQQRSAHVSGRPRHGNIVGHGGVL
jgi:hypothetical protein